MPESAQPAHRNPRPGRDPLRPAQADGHAAPAPAANPRPGHDPLARHHGRPGRKPARGGHENVGNPRPGVDPLHPRPS
jgi:hypothetical protein